MGSLLFTLSRIVMLMLPNVCPGLLKWRPVASLLFHVTYPLCWENLSCIGFSVSTTYLFSKQFSLSHWIKYIYYIFGIAVYFWVYAPYVLSRFHIFSHFYKWASMTAFATFGHASQISLGLSIFFRVHFSSNEVITKVFVSFVSNEGWFRKSFFHEVVLTSRVFGWGLRVRGVGDPRRAQILVSSAVWVLAPLFLLLLFLGLILLFSIAGQKLFLAENSEIYIFAVS